METAELSKDQIAGSLSTGYGRHNVPWAGERMTEIACQRFAPAKRSRPVLVPPHPQFIGALGAALFAMEKAGKTRPQKAAT